MMSWAALFKAKSCKFHFNVEFSFEVVCACVLKTVFNGRNPQHLLRLNTLERTLLLRVILTVADSFYFKSNKAVLVLKVIATCG